MLSDSRALGACCVHVVVIFMWCECFHVVELI